MKQRIKKIQCFKELDDGERQFEVEWENTWENETYLRETIPALLEEFLAKKKHEEENADHEIIGESLLDDRSQYVSFEIPTTATTKLNANNNSEKPKKKGINAIISRLQKSRQDNFGNQSPILSENGEISDSINSEKRHFEYNNDVTNSKAQKQQLDDDVHSNGYMAKLPMSPLEAGEATEGVLPNSLQSAALPYQLEEITRSNTFTIVSLNNQLNSNVQTLKSNVDNIKKLFPDSTPQAIEHHIAEPIYIEQSRPQSFSSTGMSAFQGNILYKCTICTECFTEALKFKQHMYMHEQVSLLKNDLPKLLKPGTYKCKFCSLMFDDGDKLKQHYGEKHEKELIHIQPLDQLYQCNICHDTFLDGSKLAQHQQAAHQRKNEVFILPKKSTEQPLQLQQHQVQTSQPTTLLITTTVAPRILTTMDTSSTVSNKLQVVNAKSESEDDVFTVGRNHPSMTTLNFQPVNDVLLSKSLSTSSNSTEIQDGKKMFRCNLCDEMFVTEGDRAKHSLIHVNRSSSLDCHICGKQFRHRTNLSTHLIVHSGIKPHQCNICLRRFTQKVNLQRHMHIHDGSRPFSCRMCRKSFTQKANLQRHILSHTEHSKEELLQALNSIPNESEVNNAINESLVEALQVVRADEPSKNLGVAIAATPTTSATTAATPGIDDQAKVTGAVFKCEICNKLFAQKVNLTKHMMIHSGARPFQCYVCGKSFRQRTSLQKHYSIHTNGSTSFICQTCNRLFVSRTNLQRHMLVHAVNGTNQCYLCDRKFSTSDNLERHFSEHIEEATPNIALPQKFFEQSTPGQTFRCATCDIVFESPIIFSQHLQCHQKGFPSTTDPQNNDLTDITKAYEENQGCPLQCNTCNLIFMSVAKLEAHMGTHTDANNDEHQVTGGVTINTQGLFAFDTDISKTMSAAVRAVDTKILIPTTPSNQITPNNSEMTPNNQHSVTSPTSSTNSVTNAQNRVSRCPVCKDIFATKEAMREHYSDTHMENNTKSEDTLLMTSAKKSINESGSNTNERFASLVNENEERLIKENEEFIKDNILGGPEEYESKGRYERGSYICKICNRELTYKYSLEKHMLLHTGSFPYRCHLCSKRFNHKASLDKHITIHNGEKPFSCHICQRPFSQRSNLQRHQLTHSQNRDFVCETCGKRFNHMASLKTHTLIHTGDKPFSCYICTKRFNQKGNLKRHIQTHRNGKRNKVNGNEDDEEELDDMLNISLDDSNEYHQENEIKQEYIEGVEDDMLNIASDEKKRVKTKKRSSDYEYNFHHDDNDQLPTMIDDKDVTLSYNGMMTADDVNMHDDEEEEDDDDTILTVVPSDAIDVMNAMNNESNLNIKDSKSPMRKKATFHCDSCSKLFSTMISLEAHKRSAHTQIICDVCGKQFSQKANLLKHKLIHMDKKPFQCKVCQKAFRQKANLQRHELIHDKARKAVNCNNCKKSFRCPWSLKQHIKLFACKPNSKGGKVKSE